MICRNPAGSDFVRAWIICPPCSYLQACNKITYLNLEQGNTCVFFSPVLFFLWLSNFTHCICRINVSLVCNSIFNDIKVVLVCSPLQSLWKVFGCWLSGFGDSLRYVNCHLWYCDNIKFQKTGEFFFILWKITPHSTCILVACNVFFYAIIWVCLIFCDFNQFIEILVGQVFPQVNMHLSSLCLLRSFSACVFCTETSWSLTCSPPPTHTHTHTHTHKELGAP